MTTINQNQMDTRVTTDWLGQHLDDPDLVVLDCTVRTESDGGRHSATKLHKVPAASRCNSLKGGRRP